MVLLSGGELGIRTPGSFHFNGFQDRRFRPLSQLSINYDYVLSISNLFTLVKHFTNICLVFFIFLQTRNYFAFRLGSVRSGKRHKK